MSFFFSRSFPRVRNFQLHSTRPNCGIIIQVSTNSIILAVFVGGFVRSSTVDFLRNCGHEKKKKKKKALEARASFSRLSGKSITSCVIRRPSLWLVEGVYEQCFWNLHGRFGVPVPASILLLLEQSTSAVPGGKGKSSEANLLSSRARQRRQ